ncbi:C-X-C chemokine receptor type 3-like [Thunnus albacares]|uniref:C-X-C chemokine receptor type 3-like n=1 Tax=Thunnus albacares TaxID=8236 RepID=UPI001CF6CF05|nr:C-X-C chemokine receptor type 3-like [Thunnus albacares]
MEMNMDVELDGIFRSNTTYDYGDYEYKEDIEPRGSEAVLIPFLYSVVLVVGLLGNGLLLAVLSQKRRTCSISDTFILLLSVADILLLVMLPFWAVQAAQDCGWCLKIHLCKISGAVFNINFYFGIFLLVCISLDHYLSIAHSTRLYSHKKPKSARISFLLVWLFSLLLIIPNWDFLVIKADPEAEEKTLCIPNYFSKLNLVSRLFHHILGFLLPAVVLIVCCSCILLMLQRSSKSLQKQRATMVILALVWIFLLCWMPYNITLIVDTFMRTSKVPQETTNSKTFLKTALLVTTALACVHACLRPLLYLSLCGNFRKQLLALLRCTRIESEGSLWELGVGEEALPAESHGGEEMKQMTSVEHQVQSAQC